MVLGKILIDLWHFLSRQNYFLKRHITQFLNSWYVFKIIEFKVNVSLWEKPSTIS